MSALVFTLKVSDTGLCYDLVGDGFRYRFGVGASFNHCAHLAVVMINEMKDSGQDVVLELPPEFMFHEA